MFPERFLQEVRQQALLQEAELTAHGFRFLTILHGDPETAEDAQALNDLAHTFWGWPTSSHRQTRGGNDYSTYICGPPDGEEILAAVERLARNLNPGWWRIQHAAQPDWSRYA